jgi:hypothetical protein
MPASNDLKTMDPGMRRDDDKGIMQSFLNITGHNIFSGLTSNKTRD